jgi:predicted ATPase
VVVRLADDAVNTAYTALADAEALGHPATLCVGIVTTVFVFFWIGNLSEVEALVERLILVATRHSLAPYYAAGFGLKGELFVRRGEAADAIPLFLNCLRSIQAGRHQILASAFTRALARAMATTGRLDDALATIDEGISEAEGSGGAFDLPEMWRFKGDILVSTGRLSAAEAEHCFRRSIELARRQDALGWELRAATSMARFRASQGHREEAREALASILGRFTQGRQAVDLQTALNLLDALA